MLLRPKGEMRRKADSGIEVAIGIDEKLSVSSGGLVVIGLLVDVALAWLFPSHARPSTPGTYSAWLETWGFVIANALVALGVYGEIFFARHVRRGEEELRDRSNAKLEAATKDAGDAIDRAAKAELETQQLKRKFAWRRVSNQQEALLIHSLKKFEGGSVTIWFFINDPESYNFALDFEVFFKRSGWKVWLQPATFEGNFLFGIRVPLLPESTSEAAAKTIRDALDDCLIEFAIGNPPPPSMTTGGRGDPPTNPLVPLYIGPKPMPFDDV